MKVDVVRFNLTHKQEAYLVYFTAVRGSGWQIEVQLPDGRCYEWQPKKEYLPSQQRARRFVLAAQATAADERVKNG